MNGASSGSAGTIGRLVRIAATRPDPPTSPPVLTIIQQCAETIDAPALDVLRQSWGRAESVYAEVHRKLRDDAAADLSWLQGAAAGSILAPGPEALEALLSARGGRYVCSDTTAIRAACDAITIGGGSPLRRYSALDALVPIVGAIDQLSESGVAERMIGRFDERHLIFIVETLDTFDAARGRSSEIVSNVDGATWIMQPGWVGEPGRDGEPAQVFPRRGISSSCGSSRRNARSSRARGRGLKT